MATAIECEQALQTLAARLDSTHAAGRGIPHDDLERTLTCSVTDLGVVYGGRLDHGRLLGIALVESADAQIRLELGSDDLVELVAGTLSFASAWVSGRVRVHAGVRDLLRLRALI